MCIVCILYCITHYALQLVEELEGNQETAESEYGTVNRSIETQYRNATVEVCTIFSCTMKHLYNQSLSDM